MRRIMIVLVGLLITGCVPGTSVEDRAADDAREKARRVGNALHGGRVWSAQDMGHRAADLDGIDVMRVGGASTGTPEGVLVVVRTSGSAPEDWPDTGTVTVKRCFELRFNRHTEWDDTPRKVSCPRGEPIRFTPWPKTPEIPSGRLERALPRVPAAGAADEAEVRAAVAALRLDPAVRVEFMTRGAVVGVVLSVRPYLSGALDCVLARVAPGRTAVWSPPRIQRMPGEGGCSAGNAIDPMPPPH
ncbi:translation initiation factor IF-2 [Actinomadura soli]|uniref:Translation initiation factor IF-2 n=1 Tax=Actinomadura soli TaxID=2508997 RepID=A0A5C4J6E7_9ACTN|nr:translation initiation factor IF-2 [Actinomadura soli]TMQ92382.1 translation initiation factor IF-2 [Actinomadura soli]